MGENILVYFIYWFIVLIGFTIQEDEVSELSNQQLHSRDSQRESESRGRSRNKNRRHGGSTSLDQRKNRLATLIKKIVEYNLFVKNTIFLLVFLKSTKKI